MGTEPLGTVAFKWKMKERKSVETEETAKKFFLKNTRKEQCHKVKVEEREMVTREAYVLERQQED